MKNIILCLIVQFLILVTLVWSIDREPPAATVDYVQALANTDSNRIAWVERGSDAEAAALERFKLYWSNLTPENITVLLPAVYSESVWFNDTVKTITNRTSLVEYMLRTASHVDSCRVEIMDVAYTEQGYYVRWHMSVVPRNSQTEEKWSSIGITHLRINSEGQVVLHQDYWDAAGGLYEHFPGIGWILRNIRARL